MRNRIDTVELENVMRRIANLTIDRFLLDKNEDSLKFVEKSDTLEVQDQRAEK